MKTSSVFGHQKKELRAYFLELLDQCPCGHSNPEDCPLFRLRQASRAEQERWLDSLTNEDAAYLAAYHHVCAGTKVEPPLACQNAA